MRNRQSFSKDFKRNLIESIISNDTTTTAASWKYSIAYAVLLYVYKHILWKIRVILKYWLELLLDRIAGEKIWKA